MKKVFFFFCLTAIIAVSVLWRLYREETRTLYRDTVTVTVIYEPSKHVTTFLGRGILGYVPEEFIVILESQSQRGKRVIRGKEIYDEMKSWDGKTVCIAYKEHPFRPFLIVSAKALQGAHLSSLFSLHKKTALSRKGCFLLGSIISCICHSNRRLASIG